MRIYLNSKQYAKLLDNKIIKDESLNEVDLTDNNPEDILAVLYMLLKGEDELIIKRHKEENDV